MVTPGSSAGSAPRVVPASIRATVSNALRQRPEWERGMGTPRAFVVPDCNLPACRMRRISEGVDACKPSGSHTPAEEGARILQCHDANLLARNSQLGKVRQEPASAKEHSLWRIEVFSPNSSLFRKQRAAEFRIAR